MMKNYAEVAFGIPVDKAFSYRIPEKMREKAKTGARVWAPFRDSVKLGYIVSLSDRPAFAEPREIRAVVDDEPILDDKMLDLTKWVSGRYFCSWGQAIEAALPQTIRRGKTDIKRRAPLEIDECENSFDLEPTNRQHRAIKEITAAISADRFGIFLLHGITGSGKTEVYLQAIRRVLREGKSAIVLVPEIALTPQTVRRFKSRFAEDVCVLHSAMTSGQKFHEWRKAKDGKAKIAIGARSAVFAPLKNLGLIVIDEEHENTYKQQDTPRYHARDVAIERARRSDAVVILGSATPSLESYYNAKTGKYRLLELKERTCGRSLPEVAIVDLRNYRGRNNRVLSNPLERSIERSLSRGEQVMLFLNRRGFSTHVFCPRCGYVVSCKRCGISLVHHIQEKSLVCHWCNYRIEPMKSCPECGKGYLSYRGLGTQRVESEIARLFPRARIARMDTDATAARGSHKRILSDFMNGRIDILIGTQMLAKGHDFANLALVGVIAADVTLNLPDFRAGERTFNLLTQVAGRAGRGLKRGRVVIQTYTPSHYTMQMASLHDYADFYRKEIAYRKELNLPPFSRLVSLTVLGRKQETVEENLKELSRVIERRISSNAMELLGPAPDVRPKINGYYRWNLTIKTTDIDGALGVLRGALGNYRKPSGAQMVVDVDPL